MKILLTILIAISMYIPTQNANAGDGSSGCGPGWYVLKDNSLVSSALRVITNGVLFPISTLGMTFGTSNCSKHKIVLNEKKSLHFATMNFFELKGEIAKGNGQFISAFSNTIGCSKGAVDTFNSEVKRNYKKIFNSEKVDPENMLLEVYKVILQNTELTQQCSLSIG